MDAVKSFNAELSSLYDVKPPISKAKMTALTRGAIKAIKFYKHVVQSVEKFILKCKPEYKVPGLYVIDSIVRQSRHQFGSDKDVFAPRFAKNMQQTFVNLYKCPAEDKSKIIRVLNLWQKNQVFPPEVVQPLFDLADPNNPIHKEFEAAAAAAAVVPANGLNTSTTTAIAKGSPALQKTTTKGIMSQPGNDATHGGTNLNLTDPNVLAQLQQLQRLLTRVPQDPSAKVDGSANVHFDKKLLDFDYGDEDDEVNPSPRPPPANDSVTNLLTNPEVLRHLQTLQQTMVAGQVAEMDMDKIRKLQEMKQQEDEFDKHLAQTVPNLPFASECEFKPSNNSSMLAGCYFLPTQDMSQPPPNYKTQAPEFDLSQIVAVQQQQSNNGDYGVGGGAANESGDVEVITLDHDDSGSNSPPGDERYGRRRRSRSRERSRDRRRSRRSRSRSPRGGRRHRSRSRDRNRKEKEKEKETERDKERKKRGLPAIKKDNLSVCSTTLWVGHLSKLVHQDDLSNTFGEFGDIVSIDLIPPRGCAFIVMHRRQDAARCLGKLKSHVLHGKAITLAWAPGKGVKGKDLKDYWEGDLGVSYIPWSKIKENIDIEMLEDGGMIDEDTMPGWMKAKVANMSSTKQIQHQPPIANYMAPMSVPPEVVVSQAQTVDTSQPPPMPGGTPNMLQPPLMPIVSPFQFNNRLLGMNVPPGMMPNIPIGVPPPNIPAPMMPNQLLGIGSQFQSGPGMMPPTQLQMQNNTENKPPPAPQNNNPETNLKSLTETLMTMTHPYNVPQPPMHDDNMDVEMEDAEKDKPSIPLSEQLQASMNQQYNSNNRRERRNSRSRDRDRHDSRGRHDSRERRDSSRGRDRDRRDRGNRWSDRDRRDSNNERDERRDREKTLNDRLKEMAGMSYDDSSRPSNAVFEPPPRNEEDFGGRHELPPPPQHMRMHPRDDMDGGPPLPPPERFMRGGRRDFRDDFDHRMRGGPPPDFFPPGRGDDFGPHPPRPMMRGGPDFGPRGPPMMRPPGPRGFYPRGPPMRGPRPGPPWKERPGFNPRFDGPDFFRGPPIFDEPHIRHRGPRFDGPRFDNRRRHDFNPDFHEGGPLPPPPSHLDRPERRSRWGGNSGGSSTSSQVREDIPPGSGDDGNSSDVVRNNEEQEEGNDEVVVVPREQTPLRDEDEVKVEENIGGEEDLGGDNETSGEVENVVEKEEEECGASEEVLE